MSYEFDSSPSEPAPKKKAPTPAANFNPFDDTEVDTSSAKASAPKADAVPGIGRVAKTASDPNEKPGAGRTPKKQTSNFGDNLDVAPGVAKDLWTCPHCGAKNKPLRETCRECSKHPDDEVIKPWFLRPLIIGPIVGAVIVFIMLIMWLTSVDMSLRPAGVIDNAMRLVSVKEETLELEESRKLFVRKEVSVSGRVIMATQYPAAPWLMVVGLGLGPKASDDDTFGQWSAEVSEEGVAVSGAPRSAVVFLLFSDDKPKLKAGDYLSVKGKAGVPEQDGLVIRGTNVNNAYTIKVDKFNTRD